MVLLREAGPEPEFDASVLGLEVVLEPLEPDANIPRFDFLAAELPPPIGPMLYVGRVPDSGVVLAVFQTDEHLCTVSGGDPWSIRRGLRALRIRRYRLCSA